MSQSRYDLQRLLDTGIQPLPDLEPPAFDALRRAIGKGPLADPLTLTSDGFLIDGHQRARAMLANGRKWVDAGDVRIIADATADNAMEWSVQLNVARRHLTVEQKAELARRLQRERKWSQAKIARLFGVSRPAVSQWLAKHPDDNGGPVVVTGLDGKTYATDTTPPAPRPERPPSSPWRPDGYAYGALAKARKTLGHDRPIAGVNVLQEAKLRALAEDLIAELEGLLAELGEPRGA